jgi:hypothetical protein
MAGGEQIQGQQQGKIGESYPDKGQRFGDKVFQGGKKKTKGPQ